MKFKWIRTAKRDRCSTLIGMRERPIFMTSVRVVDGWRSWMFGLYVVPCETPLLVVRLGPLAIELHRLRYRKGE